MTSTPSMMKFAVRTVKFWVAVGLLVVAAILLGIGSMLIVEQQRYSREGVVAEGLVLSKQIRRAARRSDESNSSTEYVVTYRFSTADGRTVEDNQKVGVSVWESLEERGPVKVEYVASDPSTNRVVGQSSPMTAYMLAIIGGAMALIGIVLLRVGTRNARDKVRIWAEGIPTEATVTAIEETSVKVNNRRLWVVRYEYDDQMGHKRTGRSDYMSADDAVAWTIGDKVPIRFDPNQPQNSVWIGRP